VVKDVTEVQMYFLGSESFGGPAIGPRYLALWGWVISALLNPLFVQFENQSTRAPSASASCASEAAVLSDSHGFVQPTNRLTHIARQPNHLPQITLQSPDATL
jgi:hypothetical protein